MIKIALVITSISFTIWSCKTQQNTLYGECGKAYFACNQILLKTNGEFEYFYFYDAGGAATLKGKWQNRKDTIILNTYLQLENMLDTVIETKRAGQIIVIKIEGGYPLNALIDSVKYKIDLKKPIIEVYKPFRNIIFHILDEKGDPTTISYNIKDQSANYFLVKLRSLNPMHILKDDKYLKTRKGLKDIDHPWTKKKVTMKHKQW
ncbi:MAG: hypothetical protein ABIR30_03495 [Chitinophagaceae bacterium]